MSVTKLGENQKLMKDGAIAFPENGKPHLVGSKCTKCGKQFFPARPLCTECFSEEMETVALSREGSIYTMTNVFVGIKGFQAPYMLGWIDIDQSRIAALIDWPVEKSDEVKIGQKVELEVDVLRTDETGTEIVGYKFKPIV